jgi:Flp pilus assembly protein TadG
LKHDLIHQRPGERGSSLVEFSLVAFLLVMLLIGVVELCRMVLVYTTVANAARAGTRYAIVHGSDNTATAAQVRTVVQNFLSAAPVNLANATIPDPVYSCADPGCTVEVTVTYQYDPFTTYFPIAGINLGSTSKGVITF